MKPDMELTAFFKANVKYAHTHELYYVDFPNHFVWNDKLCEWLPQKKRMVYRWLIYIPPNAGEKFYVQLVLSLAKNLQSFTDLCTFDGVMYPTIQEVCLARGLLQHDGEWCHCLEEGKHFQTGFLLCSLFTLLLWECSPAQPLLLWMDFREFLCDDLHWTLQHIRFSNTTQDQIYDYGLYLIKQTLLWEMNKTLKDVEMPAPEYDWKTLLLKTSVQDEMRFNPQQELVQLLQTLLLLNEEQTVAFNAILSSVDSEHQKAFFVIGAAGAGKTFLYWMICFAVHSHALTVLCMAYLGIAAQLLPGGRMAHSTFKIPFDILDDSMYAVGKCSNLAALIKTAKLII